MNKPLNMGGVRFNNFYQKISGPLSDYHLYGFGD